MKITAYAISDVGRVREHNEDMYLADPASGVFVVCDGVGGHAAGEVASRIACDTVAAGLAKQRKVLDAFGTEPTFAHRAAALKAVEQVVHEACRAVHVAGQASAERRGMACTLALLILTGETAIVAHAGDSRIYLVRGGEGHLLTEDHSFVAEQFRKGLISVAEVGRSPTSSALTRALGIQPVVEVETLTVELLDDDRFLLCSDGLSDLVTTADIVRELTTESGAKAAKKLVALANQRGGYDNITAVAVGVGIDQPRTALSVQRRMAALRSISLFEHLSFVELTKVMNLVSVESFARGERIIGEGEPGLKLYVCMAGSVDVVKGRQVLSTLEVGTFFGEMALIDQSPRSADVVAREDVKVMTLSRADFFALLRREPHLAVRLLWALCRVMNARLRNTSAELSWAKSQLPEQMTPEVAALFEMSRPADPPR